VTTADDVRRVGLALPRAYEREIRNGKVWGWVR
jgi:hypothetical protein